MLNIVADFIKNILPAKRNTTPTGWIKFDAPCCEAQGKTHRRSRRGNLILPGDGSISYSCFNCNFKASYQPGRHLTFKFRKLLAWMGAGENDIRRLVIEAIRVKDLIAPEELKPEPEAKIEFKVRDLPEGAVSFRELTAYFATLPGEDVDAKLLAKLDYVVDRRIDINHYDFYVTDSQDHKLDKRVIIPCVWEGKTIGYTSRAVDPEVKPKYYSHYEPNFVFNTNMQQRDWKFVVVCEGPFDAMAIDGVAVLSNECSETQADIIDALGKEVIVVADKDKAGANLIANAIEYGWSVSFPVWQEDDDCKDINDAVVKYGKLFVLKAILDGKETSKLKIELMRKKLHN